jgi:hypothetical protein
LNVQASSSHYWNLRESVALVERVQITTDGHRANLDAVEDEIGGDVDYAQLQEIYGAPAENDTRYSRQRVSTAR